MFGTSDNEYNPGFIKRNIYRPTEGDATNRNPTLLTTVTIPYVKGTSETRLSQSPFKFVDLRQVYSKTISWILQPYNIRVAHKPTTISYDAYWPTLKRETNPAIDRVQFTRSKATTAKLLKLVKPLHETD